ncbi:translesion error-prone DNA polymerase V autoproteolytic subunit [Pseudomonas carnis]|jgi:DNA polymerase V|uniref:Translesion error-prone DNA polymerase V autoproteolytic subunit n=2 Tax=Pseudomonas TaxID=286 RepID=A0A7Y1MFU5_9PSED|nr:MULTISPECIES: translesion error-prone DNA polymerase V autoproteolytic subunit [Pseudomonas]MBJ2236198.1 translesion error-prone DNA polymerase V autoproteolytic subunit [Pseudomonas fluorescens]MBH3369211.1 translesion error-prone DNA polymerase V autoproteolytic subunit [Pseudomonas carnis]MBJ2287384.1 translesion error-prone DNA polymerase V autoproteolytic subunit [Pseudomonas sp. MF6755]MRJ22082.1 translesion error-prone DNA polymerase V autoproteolytic subunit [Pseudomonas haemolytica]
MSATLLGPIAGGGHSLPMYSNPVSAGFPSPAADHLEKLISLDELFEIRAPHVYLAKIQGDSMQGIGIFSGDLVIVDRSKTARHGDIVIAALNAECVCKRLHCRDGQVILMAENPKYPPRYVMEGDELVIWGVVNYSVRDHER